MQAAQTTLTPEIVLTLAITAGALALFMWNRVRVDVVGIIVMATLILTGLVTPQEGISGFANEAMITVGAMFVLSAGLVRTGAIDILGKWVARLAGKSELRLLVVTLGIVIPLSAFINNTPVVVVMIPVILGLTRELGFAPSRLFMPISFGSQMGGTLTLIGTSTNLLVAGLVLDLGLERIGIFDITPPALVLTVVGVAYLLTVGRWLAPTRETTTDLVASYELREYLTALVVEPESPLAGRSLRDSRFGEEHGLQVVTVEREGERISFPRGGTVILPGDHLVVRGRIPDIARIEQIDHLRIAGTKPAFPVGPENEAGEREKQTRMAELIVPPRSPVAGHSLRQLNFRGRYGVPVLAVQRHGEPLHGRVADVALEPGDVLLVQASNDELRALHAGGDLALLGAVDLPARRTRKLKFSVPILAMVVALAAFEIMPILVSAILGVIALFITGCLTPDEAYQEVDWMVLILLGSIIPLGIAMQNTGTAEFIAAGMLQLTAPWGAYGVLGSLFLLTALLTSVISNNAAAVVLTPIAITTGLAMELSPLPFVIAVMIAASNSFITPIGYQTNTFIYGPGGYHFSDFMRVGGPLNLILLVLATFVIPFFFPFHVR
jgi:di/tricarboxylate transporter